MLRSEARALGARHGDGALIIDETTAERWRFRRGEWIADGRDLATATRLRTKPAATPSAVTLRMLGESAA
jgi:hypothetical protein